MLLLFLACTVGSPGPAAPGSMSAEAEAMDDVACTAGRFTTKHASSRPRVSKPSAPRSARPISRSLRSSWPRLKR